VDLYRLTSKLNIVRLYRIGKRKRSYDTSLRRERAAEAQARVLDVARQLFAARGYAETTLEAIATESEVALPTLYANFGSKRGLLTRLLGHLIRNDPGAASILETAGARAVFAEADPRRALAIFAEHMAEIQARIATTYEVMKGAARTEPDLAESFASAQQTRLAMLTKVAAHVAGGLRAGLTVEEAGRTIWVLASPETRQMLVTHGGYTADAYRVWLADTLAAALLA